MMSMTLGTRLSDAKRNLRETAILLWKGSPNKSPEHQAQLAAMRSLPSQVFGACMALLAAAALVAGAMPHH